MNLDIKYWMQRKKKWTSDLLDFDLFIQNVNEQTVVYDPTNYLDNELYIERLIKIAELLNKKNKKD